MKIRVLLLALAVMLTATGCVGWREGMARKWDDKPKHIRLYSGGQLIGDWTSAGMVHSEDSSNGYYFVDSKTNKLILVEGQLIIEDT